MIQKDPQNQNYKIHNIYMNFIQDLVDHVGPRSNLTLPYTCRITGYLNNHFSMLLSEKIIF